MVQETRSYNFTARQLELALALTVKTLRAQDIAKLAAYSSLTLNPASLERLIRRDLDALVAGGFPVKEKYTGKYKEYWADKQNEIIFNPSSALNLSFLKQLLAQNFEQELLKITQQGITKLLATSSLEHGSYSMRPQFPSGAFIPDLIDKISSKSWIEISYYSANSGLEAMYLIYPQRLEADFNTFYLSAFVYSKDGELLKETRTFRTDRIKAIKPVKARLMRELQNITAQIPEQIADEGMFAGQTAVVKVSSRCASVLLPQASLALPYHTDLTNPASLASLAAKGTEEKDVLPVMSADIECDNWLMVLPNIHKEDLFELLNFYGRDIKLLHPISLQEEFIARICHVLTVLKADKCAVDVSSSESQV